MGMAERDVRPGRTGGRLGTAPAADISPMLPVRTCSTVSRGCHELLHARARALRRVRSLACLGSTAAASAARRPAAGAKCRY